MTKLPTSASGSTFTHNVDTWDINTLVNLTHHQTPTEFPLETLMNFMRCNPVTDWKRVEKADLEAPILIYLRNDDIIIVSGKHRVTKALSEKRSFIKSHILTAQQMEQAKVVAPK